jgi:hypothetical protein
MMNPLDVTPNIENPVVGFQCYVNLPGCPGQNRRQPESGAGNINQTAGFVIYLQNHALLDSFVFPSIHYRAPFALYHNQAFKIKGKIKNAAPISGLKEFF